MRGSLGSPRRTFCCQRGVSSWRRRKFVTTLCEITCTKPFQARQPRISVKREKAKVVGASRTEHRGMIGRLTARFYLEQVGDAGHHAQPIAFPARHLRFSGLWLSATPPGAPGTARALATGATAAEAFGSEGYPSESMGSNRRCSAFHASAELKRKDWTPSEFDITCTGSKATRSS